MEVLDLALLLFVVVLLSAVAWILDYAKRLGCLEDLKRGATQDLRLWSRMRTVQRLALMTGLWCFIAVLTPSQYHDYLLYPWVAILLVWWPIAFVRESKRCS